MAFGTPVTTDKRRRDFYSYPSKGYASRARRIPDICQRAAGEKKLR